MCPSHPSPILPGHSSRGRRPCYPSGCRPRSEWFGNPRVPKQRRLCEGSQHHRGPPRRTLACWGLEASGAWRWCGQRKACPAGATWFRGETTRSEQVSGSGPHRVPGDPLDRARFVRVLKPATAWSMHATGPHRVREHKERRREENASSSHRAVPAVLRSFCWQGLSRTRARTHRGACGRVWVCTHGAHPLLP